MNILVLFYSFNQVICSCHFNLVFFSPPPPPQFCESKEGCSRKEVKLPDKMTYVGPAGLGEEVLYMCTRQAERIGRVGKVLRPKLGKASPPLFAKNFFFFLKDV